MVQRGRDLLEHREGGAEGASLLFTQIIGGPAFSKGLRRGRQECPPSVNSYSGEAGSLGVLCVLCESLFLDARCLMPDAGGGWFVISVQSRDKPAPTVYHAFSFHHSITPFDHDNPLCPPRHAAVPCEAFS